MFTGQVRKLARYPQALAVAGAVLLVVVLVFVDHALGGWFDRWFYVWATPVVIGYRHGIRALVLRYDQGPRE